jgi:hypothetical protein
VYTQASLGRGTQQGASCLIIDNPQQIRSQSRRVLPYALLPSRCSLPTFHFFLFIDLRIAPPACPPQRSFVFKHLQIAWRATPLFSQPSALPGVALVRLTKNLFGSHSVRAQIARDRSRATNFTVQETHYGSAAVPRLDDGAVDSCKGSA